MSICPPPRPPHRLPRCRRLRLPRCGGPCPTPHPHDTATNIIVIVLLFHFALLLQLNLVLYVIVTAPWYASSVPLSYIALVFVLRRASGCAAAACRAAAAFACRAAAAKQLQPNCRLPRRPRQRPAAVSGRSFVIITCLCCCAFIAMYLYVVFCALIGLF